MQVSLPWESEGWWRMFRCRPFLLAEERHLALLGSLYLLR
jgi:hypothetical protein